MHWVIRIIMIYCTRQQDRYRKASMSNIYCYIKMLNIIALYNILQLTRS